MVSAPATDFKGWNKMSLGQTNLKSDISKAKETTPSLQGWQQQLMFNSTCKLSLVQQQNKNIFGFYFQWVGTEAQNAAGEGGFRIMRMWDGELKSSSKSCNSCYVDGQHPLHKGDGYWPVSVTGTEKLLNREESPGHQQHSLPLSIETFLIALSDTTSHQGSPWTYGQAHMKELISSQSN